MNHSCDGPTRPRPAFGSRLALWVTAAILAIAAATPAMAIEFRTGQHVVVAAEEVIPDDLYVGGETVTVEGRIEGDLIASGREVRVNGEVTGDVMAAGQAVVINGLVGDDVRIAGMALKLGPRGRVGDDVVSAGFSLETTPESVTGGSLLFSGLQALLAGDITEGLFGSMSALEIRGGIGGDSEIEVEGDAGMSSFAQYLPSPVALPVVAGGLEIAEGARIEGDLEYTSSTEARGAGAGALTRVEPAAAADAGQVTRKSVWPGRILRWVGLLVLGLLLALWIPRWLEGPGTEVRSRPLAAAGIGLLGVAAVPVAVLLVLALAVVATFVLGLLKLGSLAALALVLGLTGVGLLVLVFWVVSAYLAPLVVGLCTGRWVLERVAATRAAGMILPLAVGLVLLALLRYVPILGFLVGLVVLLVGWGAILWWLWKASRPVEPAAAA